ncbi:MULTISPECIES: hypothetical protein [unclassified Mesorhizobium]|uniref:hypothetical protein n=1 Tax=unclassified Mesorhizobium TaxID=325217 RepID=UPI00112A0965|nr:MULTISPECIES: hypothetical protein [unclassified Mesorhizobium]TPK42311.1 hypothetical protein FJ550_30215 [Mesorhizobium sp. B2-5-2]TPL44494.1 hypothetical protein FJ961_03925 [Mesorhizobium sp. B2-4-5]TPM68681.1 hypothetical protein FJ968_29730 [Mesorhizobium sp. B2-1-6]TPN71759.1 hypothetical protein FJ985_30720 [Mesorhizobium sp. B1-1-2]
MGWLGWTEDQALNADVNAILIGLNGRGDMIDSILRAVFGGRDEPEVEDTEEAEMTEARFDAMFVRG